MADREPMSDGQLVTATLAGDPEAYRQLVTRYQGHVYALAYSLVGNWSDAQDLAQETFIRAYSNLDKLREPERFASWLRRVTFGVTMDWLRTFRPKLFAQFDGRVDLDILEIPDFEPGPAEVAERRELAEAVLAALASLPSKYRVPLTMFHLDGLSYQKVAAFLDIPLGTAKSMIHRAREKLRAALAQTLSQEAMPMVQDVFDEHKLPGEFASRVLANVPDVNWGSAENEFCGSLVAWLQFTGRPAPYHYALAVSGYAFEVMWSRTWKATCAKRNIEDTEQEHIRRTFAALGYEYEVLHKGQAGADEERFREAITQRIDRGEPVIASGIAGPAPGLVAGYERGGDVLVGRSYFHDGRNGYYRQAEWYNDCDALVLVGRRIDPVSPREVLCRTLKVAVAFAHGSHAIEGIAAGLAAYDAWANSLLRDEDFPAGNLPVLTKRCNVSNAIVLPALLEARRMAARFLAEQEEVEPRAAAHMRAAGAAYEAEAAVLKGVFEHVPLCTAPEAQRLAFAERPLRQFLVDHLLRAKDLDRQAVEHLERVLEVIDR